jgi:hypothetical protein
MIKKSERKQNFKQKRKKRKEKEKKKKSGKKLIGGLGARRQLAIKGVI